MRNFHRHLKLIRVNGVYDTFERLLVRDVLVLFQAERAVQQVVSSVPNVTYRYLLAIDVVFTIETVEIELVDANRQCFAYIRSTYRKRLACLQKYASDFLFVPQDLLLNAEKFYQIFLKQVNVDKIDFVLPEKQREDSLCNKCANSSRCW